MASGRDETETDDPGSTINLRPFRKRPKSDPGGTPRKSRRAKAKHRRRKRRIAAFGLALAVLATTAFVVGSVFYASVDLPEELDEALSQGSTVYYSDGTTVMGELAAERRTSVDLDAIADDVEHAVVAAEDANFYDHLGVDAKGVLRALVNNIRGGDQQGASTLTQQYVGYVADIRGDGSYLRKAREAAMAMKMEEAYSKDEIPNHYLNIVYFGRGAYGVEAAAQAFFGRSAADLSTSQSALLVAQIKSPDGPYDPRDPYGGGGSVEEAAERWAYVLDRMVETGALEPVKRDALTALPETLDPTDDPEGLGPEGFVTNGFVLRELAAAGLTAEEVLRGGFDIVTTLDPELQELAVEHTGIREVHAEDERLAAALTAVEPGTGRVLAYYGGENGAGLDLASDVGHRPGTSFGPVVLAASVRSGVDPWALVDGSSPQTFDTYTDAEGEPLELVNIGGASVERISLSEAVGAKLDTPVYAVAERIGGDVIAQTAADLGVDRFWDPHDVDEDGIAAELAADGATGVHPDIGIGAYPITTLDAATLHATLAADGTTAEPYFVAAVEGPEGRLYRAEPQIEEPADDFGEWAAAEAALPLYQNGYEADDGEVAVNASSTWHTGFAPGLALAVWAGDERKEGDGSSHEGTIAERIWWQVMNGRSDRYRLGEEARGPGFAGGNPDDIEDQREAEEELPEPEDAEEAPQQEESWPEDPGEAPAEPSTDAPT